jgi:hypothetical protein
LNRGERVEAALRSSQFKIYEGAAHGLFVTHKEQLKGEEFLSYFKSSPHFIKVFCSKCGANLPTVNHELNHIAVPPSAMDTPIEQQPVAHFYTRTACRLRQQSKASWFAIDDNGQQYEWG